MNIRVYPEYFQGSLLEKGIEIFGKVTEDKFSRMCLTKNGRVEIFYDKISSDGRNTGGSDKQSPVFYEIDDIVIGLVCCMDVNNPELLNGVKAEISNSKCRYKIITISAQMTSDWFSQSELSRDLHGFIIVLSNGNKNGIKSFIARENGHKVNEFEINIGNSRIINCGHT